MTPVSQVEQLRQTVLHSLSPLLPPGRRVALLDFPAYGNVGDSAIWLGELACLRDLGCPPPSYTCDAETYDRGALAERIGDGTILLSGGGNFGDLYEVHQLFRERVITDFPRNPIIQLACSIDFGDRKALERARRVHGRHPALTLLARDERGRDVMRAEFGERVLLCPDMALCMGPLRRTGPPAIDTLWLCRDDAESGWPHPARFAGAARADWTEEPRWGWKVLRRVGGSLAERFRSGMARRAVSASYPLLARRRVAAGLRLLSGARTVVTDRLHGHVLCLLLDIPHVLLDTRHGKNGSFFRTWSESAPRAHWADSPARAREMVAALLGSQGDDGVQCG